MIYRKKIFNQARINLFHFISLFDIVKNKLRAGGNENLQKFKDSQCQLRGARKGGQGGASAPPWKLRCQVFFVFKFAK